MKFSIIIPAHNAEDRIEKALESVKMQAYGDYELIVICDSCEDRTQEIAEQYGAITEAVDYKNDGMTRNRGLDIAQGDWVLFMDDDDWWIHEHVLDRIAGKLTDEMDVLCFSFIWKGVGYATPLSNGGSLFPSVWNKVWRRSCIGDTRFPNIYSISDFYFHKAMMEKQPRVHLWDQAFYYYNYLRPGSLSEAMGRTAPATKKYWEKN